MDTLETIIAYLTDCFNSQLFSDFPSPLSRKPIIHYYQEHLPTLFDELFAYRQQRSLSHCLSPTTSSKIIRPMPFIPLSIVNNPLKLEDLRETTSLIHKYRSTLRPEEFVLRGRNKHDLFYFGIAWGLSIQNTLMPLLRLDELRLFLTQYLDSRTQKSFRFTKRDHHQAINNFLLGYIICMVNPESLKNICENTLPKKIEHLESTQNKKRRRTSPKKYSEEPSSKESKKSAGGKSTKETTSTGKINPNIIQNLIGIGLLPPFADRPFHEAPPSSIIQRHSSTDFFATFGLEKKLDDGQLLSPQEPSPKYNPFSQ